MLNARIGIQRMLAQSLDVLTHPQARLYQFETDVVTANDLRFEYVRIAILGMFDQVYAGGVIREQRTKCIHHQIQHLVQVERPAYFLRDIQQQAQLCFC